MNDHRNTYILMSTALALILTIPFISIALDSKELAAAQIAATSASPVPTPAALLGAVPGSAVSAAADTPLVPEVAKNSADATDPSHSVEEAERSDPLAALDSADRPVAEAIRDLLATKSDRLFANKNERAAVLAFYVSRNLAPLWVENGVENARAEAVIARLKNSDSDGLDPSQYIAPSFAGLAPEALAEAELKLTQIVLTYARHLQAGRFPYTRVSRNIELPQVMPEPADVLNSVAHAADAGEALDSFSPQQEPYRKLKAILAELRSKPAAHAESSRQMDTIIANMERWRWYPRDLGNAHVLVNLPDFTLKVMHNGAQAWTTRIVIGKPGMPTPLLSETMKSITVNPTWHVPQSIVQNEYLPALAQDPTVLERMGLRVSYNGGHVEVTQPPGAGNALGRIRFNFPNRFSVYHHDTPDKNLFAQDFRAYSHGCMRVQDPAKYAEVLLDIARPREHWTAERIKRMFGTSEQDIQLQATPIWVHLTYQTAFIDNAGRLQIRRDLYGLDTRTLAAIKANRGTVEREAGRKQPLASGTSIVKPARPARTAAQSTFQASSSTLAFHPLYR
jgi:murein L,D-transpeptidase YcbB/YkuD